MNSWLYFLKTIVILRIGDPDGGGGGGNHPSGFLEPRPLRFLRIASDGDGIVSYEHLVFLLTAGVLNLWPNLYFGVLNSTLWAARSTPRDDTAFVVVF